MSNTLLNRSYCLIYQVNIIPDQRIIVCRNTSSYFSVSIIEFIDTWCHPRVHSICYEWIIDEFLVWGTQLPVILEIGGSRYALPHKILIIRHIRQGRTIWIEDRTIHGTLHTQTVCGWRRFEPWKPTKTIHRHVLTFTIKYHPSCWTLSFTFLLPQSSSIQGEAPSPSHYPQHRWTPDTSNNR